MASVSRRAFRLASTKITDGAGYAGSVAQWTRTAAISQCRPLADLCGRFGPYTTCGATVQNFSSNEYDDFGTNAGVYSTKSQDFDFAVRDADTFADGNQPLPITMAAGNYKQNTPNDLTTAVMSPATAKNLISVGGAESRRDTIPPNCVTDGGENPTMRNLADGYDVIGYFSRRGTADGRITPDLVAPASLAYGPRTAWPDAGLFCARAMDPNSGSPQYHGASGTSFASPVAAGAIALLRYYYGATYGITPSPALYKAMLVANARSLTNAVDRLQTSINGTTAYVEAWPTPAQGFGMISLDKLLSASTIKAWRDQTVVLTQGGQEAWTVTVADPYQPVRIVLAWTDAPGVINLSQTLKNDLDLWAFFPGDSSTYVGNSTDASGYSWVPCRIGPGCPAPFDRKNNVEVLNINPAKFTYLGNRTFTVNVTAHTLADIGVPGAGGGFNQDFAIFVMNGTMQ